LEETETSEEVPEETETTESDSEETETVETEVAETETEDFAAEETPTESQAEPEELSVQKDADETKETEIEAQETPAIEKVESEMPIETEAEKTVAAPLGSDMLLNFNHEVVVEIARTQLTGEEITQITYGSVIELDKIAGEPVNLVLDGKTIALGEVVQINKDKLGIRIVGVIQD
ncbi:MAG TPA: flagellar motor switch protein FliN, partial [Deltaproteobacteria bacterium]|nr:flagellar motor switch protein FliN [Deltaproteobacteria bacterium]